MRLQTRALFQKNFFFHTAFVVILVLISAKAFPQSYFHTRFGTTNEESARAVCQLLNKNYVVAGWTTGSGIQQTDLYFAITDSLGFPLLQKNIGGYLSESANAVAALPDSGFVLAGFTSSYGHGGYDAWLIRLNKHGNVVWTKTFGGADWDFANSVFIDNNGSIIVGGSTYSFGKGKKDAFILNMDLNGNITWFRSYGGPDDDEWMKVIPLNKGGYAGVGTTKSYGGDTLGEVWICLLDAVGDSLKFTTRGGLGKQRGMGIAEHKNGSFYVAGTSWVSDNLKEEVYLLRLSGSLALTWEKTLGYAGEDDISWDLKASRSVKGDFIFSYTTLENKGFGKDPKMLLMDSLGGYSGGGYLGSSRDEEILAINNSLDKGYIMAGYTEGFDAKNKDIYLIKFDSLMNPGSYYVGEPEHTNERVNETLSASPNPFKTGLVINVPPAYQGSSLVLTDVLGHTVYQYDNVPQGNLEINTGKMPAGIYFLLIYGSHKTDKLKLICEE